MLRADRMGTDHGFPGNRSEPARQGEKPWSVPTPKAARIRDAAIVAVLLAGLAAAGCSWEQAYYAAQTWQRNECNRKVDAGDRERCLAQTATSYEGYRQQREATPPPPK
jgi:hypothetical protein